MFHTIEFHAKLVVDLEIPSKNGLERMMVRKGTRLKARIKPYDGPVEVADLLFEDGTTARMVPFESFSFVD